MLIKGTTIGSDGSPIICDAFRLTTVTATQLGGIIAARWSHRGSIRLSPCAAVVLTIQVIQLVLQNF